MTTTTSTDQITTYGRGCGGSRWRARCPFAELFGESGSMRWHGQPGGGLLIVVFRGPGLGKTLGTWLGDDGAHHD